MKLGYIILQIDEAQFHAKKNDRRHWAPSGQPFQLRTKWTSGMPKICVCAAICTEVGLVSALLKQTPFTHDDMLDMLKSLRKFFGQKKIAVFWDNASYHKTDVVWQTAK